MRWPVAVALAISLFSGRSFAALPDGVILCEKILTTYPNWYGQPNIGFIVVTEDGKQVAEFDARIVRGGRVMLDVYFQVNGPWRQKGLSKEIVAALFKAEPGINMIRAELIGNNFEEFSKGLGKGLNQFDAIRETPFYKVFAPYGFTNIRLRKIDGKEIEVSLNRTGNNP